MAKMFLTAVLILSVATGYVSTLCVDVSNLGENQATLNSCLNTVTTAAQALENNPLTPIETFTVYVDAVFNAAEEDFDFCCETYEADEAVAQMKQETLMANVEDMREEPVVTFVPEDENKQYTLVFLVLEHDFAPYLLWLKYDVPGNDAAQGIVGMAYDGPAEESRVMLMAFEQTAALLSFDITKHVECGNNRCNFTVDTLVTEHGLIQVGQNWAKPKETDYTVYRESIVEGADLEEICGGRDNVISVDANEVVCDPSQEGSSGHLQHNMLLIFGVFLLKTLLSVM